MIGDEMLKSGTYMFYVSPRSIREFLKPLVVTLGLHAILFWPFRNSVTLTASQFIVGKGWMFHSNPISKSLERIESVELSQNVVKERPFSYGDISVQTDASTEAPIDVLDVQDPRFVQALYYLRSSRNPSEMPELLRKAKWLKPAFWEVRQAVGFFLIRSFLGLFIFWLLLLLAVSLLLVEPAIMLLAFVILAIGIFGIIIFP